MPAEENNISAGDLQKKLEELIGEDRLKSITVYDRNGNALLTCTLAPGIPKKLLIPLPPFARSIADSAEDSCIGFDTRNGTDTVIQQKALLDIIHHSLKTIKKYRKKIQEGAQAEDVHQFRVEIKKLRAFLRMMPAITDHALTMPRSLKDQYRKAGAIRELQLMIASKPGPHLKQKYSRQLKRKKAQLIAQTNTRKIRLMIKKAGKKISRQLPAYLPVSVAAKFIQDKLQVIHTVTRKKDLTDEEIHSIRKDLKDILYDVKSIGANSPAILHEMHWPAEKEKFYVNFAEELGKYQDCNVELKKLEEDALSTAVAGDQEIRELLIRQRSAKDQMRDALQKEFVDTRI